MKIPFLKMHGAANDFVVIDHRTPLLPESPEALFRAMCDRRRGIGADGVLLLESDPELDYRMRYFNADGRTAEWCGNGARCLAWLALEKGLGRGGEVRYRSDVGIQSAHRDASGRGIELHLGLVPRGARAEVEAAGRRFEGLVLRPGVPHFVTEIEGLAGVPVADWGRALRQSPRFAPEGVNVDFVSRLGASRVAMRTYERGVEAETLACGSGAIASALWAGESGDRSPVTVVTAGGDELVVRFEPAEADDKDVHLAGPAAVAFSGEWTL